MQDERTVVVRDPAELALPSTRRKFLQALGLGGAIVLMPAVFAACDDNKITGTTSTAAQTISLSTDVGIFQFAYVLEQLEAAFYTQVVNGLSNFGSIFSQAEQEMLVDIRNDEVTHREFLRKVLGSSIPDLTFNFSTISADRKSLLQTAFALETTGIGAYNGAGKALKNAKNLLIAGKIVSIEARHTAAIADALDIAGGSAGGTAYADLTNALAVSLGAKDANGLDAADTTEQVVLNNAQPFIVNKITLS